MVIMGFLGTHRGKIIFSALIGIQVFFIASICYFFRPGLFSFSAIAPDFCLLVLANIFSSLITLWMLSYLLTPIYFTPQTLSKYLQSHKLDDLLINFPENSNTLISDTEKALDDILRHLVNYDTLTKLPTRSLFQSYIQEAISTTQNDKQFALIVLDLNSLKNINSTLGRKVGDLLLVKVAQRLSTCLSSGDTLARFGGDEFVVLRTDINNSNCLITLANDLLNSLVLPFCLYGKEIHCDAKIGITIYPFDGITVEQLLQNADTAIYQAKQHKLNTYQFYSQAMSKKLKRALIIKEKMRHALKNEELSLHYQPRIDISTGRLVGIEALLRWYNPELGWISPNEFIPIAEESNLIMPIGEWVLYSACLQNRQWQKAQLAPVKVSVNLSTCQFKQQNLLETVNRILDDTGLDTAYLELEITESILVENIDKAIAILGELKRKGISIALDDFGTGYSSLSYLQKLPIDTLKIDRSFVTNLATNPDDIAISKAIIALAQSLELNVTAEGVETKAQLDYLQKQGCNEAQGYYFSKPLPNELMQKFLTSNFCSLRETRFANDDRSEPM